jgi:hypothetical protein
MNTTATQPSQNAKTLCLFASSEEAMKSQQQTNRVKRTHILTRTSERLPDTAITRAGRRTTDDVIYLLCDTLCSFLYTTDSICKNC